MARRNRFVVHEPHEHYLWVPRRRERLVGVEAIGRDETTIVRLRDETEHIREITEADAGPLHDAFGGWVRYTAREKCGRRTVAAPDP